MAAYLLCVVVAFSVVVSRPSTSTRAGAPESGWWRSFTVLIAKARKQIAAGDYGAAEQAFSEGFARAPAHDYKIAAARYLSGAAGAIRLPGRFASVTEAPNRPLKPPAIGSTLGRQT